MENFLVDGHNINQIIKKLKKIKSQKLTSPVLILAKTTKGKGIKFIENDPIRHTKGLDSKEIIMAKKNSQTDMKNKKILESFQRDLVHINTF